MKLQAELDCQKKLIKAKDAQIDLLTKIVEKE